MDVLVREREGPRYWYAGKLSAKNWSFFYTFKFGKIESRGSHLCVILVFFICIPQPPIHWLSKGPLRSLCERQSGPPLPSPPLTGWGYTSCKTLDKQPRGHVWGEMCHWGIGSSETIVANWRSQGGLRTRENDVVGAETWRLLSRK